MVSHRMDRIVWFGWDRMTDRKAPRVLCACKNFTCTCWPWRHGRDRQMAGDDRAWN